MWIKIFPNGTLYVSLQPDVTKFALDFVTTLTIYAQFISFTYMSERTNVPKHLC